MQAGVFAAVVASALAELPAVCQLQAPVSGELVAQADAQAVEIVGLFAGEFVHVPEVGVVLKGIQGERTAKLCAHETGKWVLHVSRPKEEIPIQPTGNALGNRIQK